VVVFGFFVKKEVGLVLCPSVRGVQPLTTLTLQINKNILGEHIVANRVKKWLDRVDAWTDFGINKKTMENNMGETL
jgi:hypothetical protein